MTDPERSTGWETRLMLSRARLPAAVILNLVIPTVIASWHLRLSWKVNTLAYVTSSLVAALVVGLDLVHRGTL